MHIEQLGHVLIIEDDDEMRDSMESLLTSTGFTVHVWSKPELFIRQLPEVAPAAVITDMRMPGMTGLDLHQQLLASGRTFPVIYISGESTLHQSVKAMKLGAFEFLVKPFTREELLKAVTAAIERDRLQLRLQIKRFQLDECLRLLTPREREVYELLCKGFNNYEITQELGVSLPTAKQFKSSVMRKLKIRSLSELFKLNTK